MPCGIVGAYGKNVFLDLYQGLYALQHRGKESAGIVTSRAGKIRVKHGLGITSDIFNEHDSIELQGDVGTAQLRYSTQGGTGLRNAQPIVAETGNGEIVLAHNGDLVQAKVLIPKRRKEGAIFRTCLLYTSPSPRD